MREKADREEEKEAGKSFRVLSISERLNHGEVLNKQALSNEFKVSPKTIQRDLDTLKIYYFERDRSMLEFDVRKGGYLLEQQSAFHLTNREIVALNKILLESRALNKEEFSQLFEKLVLQAAPEDRVSIRELLSNGHYHYVAVHHGVPLLSRIWDVTQYIQQHRIISFQYQRQNLTVKQYVLKPVGLVFSEFYFYLIGYIKDLDKPYPAIFRLDKVDVIKPTKEHFNIPYSSRFEEGAFKNRIQFMYAGEVMKIAFRFWGSSLEAVLDRLPTARIKEQNGKEAVVEADIYGKGIKMWLLSQMEYLEVLSPASFRAEMKQTIRNMLAVYDEKGEN